jgi:hypothetical protein
MAIEFPWFAKKFAANAGVAASGREWINVDGTSPGISTRFTLY